MTKKHYHHHIEEATGEPVESYRVVCERCRKVLGDVPDGSLRGLKFVMCRDCFGAGEPAIIEIKGESYPEELDPELHEFNRITKKVAESAKRYRYAERHPEIASEAYLLRKRQRLDEALDEYEKMVAGE